MLDARNELQTNGPTSSYLLTRSIVGGCRTSSDASHVMSNCRRRSRRRLLLLMFYWCGYRVAMLLVVMGNSSIIDSPSRVEVITIWYSLRLSANIDFKPSLRAISNRFLIIFFFNFRSFSASSALFQFRWNVLQITKSDPLNIPKYVAKLQLYIYNRHELSCYSITWL